MMHSGRGPRWGSCPLARFPDQSTAGRWFRCGRRPHPEAVVALQGTLDTFALPDVLRLLASTKKTGRLHLTGNRGDGSVWVDTGDVVKVEASGARAVSTAAAEV